MNCDLVRRATKIAGLKVVFGTDAVAGADGRNAEEFIDRVHCGVEPMAAMVSAQSLGAEAMGLGDEIGALAPGMQADIIALDGDPSERHHGCAAGGVRHEGRRDLQERREGCYSCLCGGEALRRRFACEGKSLEAGVVDTARESRFFPFRMTLRRVKNAIQAQGVKP